MPISLLSVEGYRSIRTAWGWLGTVNVVLGPNGSGKTNLYRSLALLVEAAQGRTARDFHHGLLKAAAVRQRHRTAVSFKRLLAGPV